MATASQPEDRRFNPTAAVLAWVLPGLGHMSLGHRKRGWLIMLGVLFLFGSGVLVGGVDCVDRKQDPLWFLAQSLCGPVAFVVDVLNPGYPRNLPDDYQARAMESAIQAKLWRIGLNKPNEMGTLFCALAGLMNLVVILDAMYFAPKGVEGGHPHRRASDAAAETNARASI